MATEVAFGPESLGYSKSEVDDIVANALERTGISHLREAYPPTLRRGEKQRVAIASALAMQSKILSLMNQPLAKTAWPKEYWNYYVNSMQRA